MAPEGITRTVFPSGLYILALCPAGAGLTRWPAGSEPIPEDWRVRVAPEFPASRKCPGQGAPAGRGIGSRARAGCKAPGRAPPAAPVRRAPSAERAAPIRVKATTPAGRPRLKKDVGTLLRKCGERVSWPYQENPLAPPGGASEKASIPPASKALTPSVSRSINASYRKETEAKRSHR